MAFQVFESKDLIICLFSLDEFSMGRSSFTFSTLRMHYLNSFLLHAGDGEVDPDEFLRMMKRTGYGQ